ncbi:voltage-dependent T-type calcium channel subunit alpha-1I-like [Pseudoliparis swirei]|uniref:voltage-dependent T-type calcium channel subunit alpha-1I-like n=1 Tax=Pseudoliparis swirei TaxID=2059687 RepID=UPI0024BD72FC|nr:voltage-dependent T-type calcium channel subunit alpha-1I-like [Pseudoliparis swirei]
MVTPTGLKVVSMGLYLGQKAYLRSSWNVLDGFLVLVSLTDIVVSVAGGAKILGVLRVLRLLRTLRPLRVISRAPGLKLVVETLITSLKPIGNIVLICCAFFIIFGILGVQLFKGKFFYCSGFDVKNITNKSDCLVNNYHWAHHKYNFDNLGQRLRSSRTTRRMAPAGWQSTLWSAAITWTCGSPASSASTSPPCRWSTTGSPRSGAGLTTGGGG